MKNELIYAVIPAFNASETLKSVILSLRQCGMATRIIVVNDGSTDDTKETTKLLDIETIEHHKNLGKGAALRSGFQFAHKMKADLILTLDADGQHNPFEATKLLEGISAGNADIVIGSRIANLKDMPFHRILSNVITSKLISWRIKQTIEDSQSGFRLIRTDVTKKVMLTTKKFDLESELLIKAGLQNFKIASVPIATIYNKKSKSKVGVMDIFRFIVLFVRSLAWKRMSLCSNK